MKCREAKQEMALHLGHDGTDQRPWEEVRRHVAACPDCRAHYARLKEALLVLERSDAPDTYETRGSLWPQLSARLDAPAPQPRGRRPGRWLPLASVAAACLLFVSVWTYSPAPPLDAQHPGVGRQTISTLPDFTPANPESHHSREAREAEQRAKQHAEKPREM
jgi:ferric-dicitrate binding protein FerR (iron transport regulator)